MMTQYVTILFPINYCIQPINIANITYIQNQLLGIYALILRHIFLLFL